ncbi:MAG: hypothetical protein KGI27_08910 [Thaumarchaeota archaeon]|nr:hypothetical protein [Nitrososphaerota archaeon]
MKLFYSGIKSKETMYAYKKTLREFLASVVEFHGTFEERARQFVEYARKNPSETKQLLKNYAAYLKERTEKPRESPEYLNPNTLPNKLKSIKKFLKMNEIPIEWANIEAIFPERNNIQQTRGYTTEEIKRILDYSTDVEMDFAILAESSSGIRVGAWEDQVWGNIRPIYDAGDGTYIHDVIKAGAKPKIVCASIVVYDETSSKYLSLISIEAWDKLQAVKEKWIRRRGREPRTDDPIFITRYKDGRAFSKIGIKNKLNKLILKSGVQKPLTEGQRNHEVPMTHGMRKRWNKIMSEQKINGESQANLIRKERLFGHKVGVTKLDNSYFYSEIEESIPQYLQAMRELMISDEYRNRRDLQILKDENQKLQQTIKEKDNALQMVEELKAKMERLEKYQRI